MLKRNDSTYAYMIGAQPPSGGCVLKLVESASNEQATYQPPSGGCVLKQQLSSDAVNYTRPAAFRRLCVETLWLTRLNRIMHPAAFRRLCVETRS